jgi:hypothetical protein
MGHPPGGSSSDMRIRRNNGKSIRRKADTEREAETQKIKDLKFTVGTAPSELQLPTS